MADDDRRENYWPERIDLNLKLGIRDTRVPKTEFEIDKALNIATANHVTLLVLQDDYVFCAQ